MIRKIFGTIGIILAVSCSNEAEPETTNKRSCLSSYITTPCALIDIAQVADYAGVDPVEIEMEVPEEIPLEEVNQYSRIFCEYRWPSERVSVTTIEWNNSELQNEIPLDNVVSIGDIEIIEEDDLLTLNNQTETYTEYFHRVRVGKNNINSESLYGVGEMASVSIIEAMNHSNYNITSIWVLHNNMNFNIEVDISDSDEEDLALAKKLALAILAKCTE